MSKNINQQIIKKNSTIDFDDSLSAESRKTIVEVLKKNNEFIPPVDYSDPKNFIKYGSAEFYYKNTIQNIYKNYPYDGPKRDKEKFYNELALYEKYIFDHEYPKTTGYIHLTESQYININLNKLENLDERKTPDGNIYDINSQKNSPLFLNNLSGNTVEFWYKEDANAPSTTYALFEITGAEGQNLYIGAGATLYFMYASGTSGVNSITEIASDSSIQWSSIKKNWHHYSFTFISNQNTDKIDVSLTIDGNDPRSSYSKTVTGSFGTSILNAFSTKNTYATIGSRYIGSTQARACGCFDEFRFWTSARNSKFVKLTWFSTIDGGIDSSNSLNDLGFYYKFNEGVTSDSSNNVYDKIVLDYSGHFLNGEIKNYNYVYSPKNTGSAMDESGFFDFNEKKDIIIYPSNPLVNEYLVKKEEEGRSYDAENTSQFFNLFPEWIRNEDRINDNELRNITQIISSYLDKLYLQIDYLNKIKYIDYTSGSNKPAPFSKKLLEYKSVYTDEIFKNVDLIEEIFERNEERPYEENIFNIRNNIYKNIYNNINYVYKSKGTEKSYRNLFRSFGIDDEIIKFVVYSKNEDIDLSQEKVIFSNQKRSLVDFSDIENHNSTIYQYNYNSNPSAIVNYLEIGGNYRVFSLLPNTFECQIIFPNIDQKKNSSKWNLQDVSSSLFGVHSAISTGSDTTWDPDDKFNFQVYALRADRDSKGVKFALKTNGFGLSDTLISSSYFADVYDNTKWTFAVKIYPEVDDYSFFTSSLMSASNYNLEFYGYQMEAGVMQNQFLLTQSLVTEDAKDALIKNKRIYLGAHRNNFTGSVLQQSDVKFINARYWIENLSEETLKNHANNFNSYSPNFSTKKSFLGFLSGSYSLETINQIDTLLLNWDFTNITSSDASGKFIVNDVKTTPGVSHYLKDTINNYYYGIGEFFPASSEKVVNYEYLQILKNELPERVNISDTIKIKNEDDLFYSREYKPIENFINIENSMYSIISEEMMNMFTSIKDFNNLIGNPLNTYKKEYKEINFLRKIFFSKVQNIPSLEKYLNLFKWIDSSINQIIKQITPASADIPEYISTIIESHILERNKYERKLPMFQEAQKLNSYPIKGISELIYSWASGSAPIGEPNQNGLWNLNGQLNNKKLWLKERAERTFKYASSDNSIVDKNREQILDSIINENDQKEYNVKDDSGLKYIASDYILKRASKPYRFYIDTFIGVKRNKMYITLRDTNKL